jgi:hypothetical protein
MSANSASVIPAVDPVRDRQISSALPTPYRLADLLRIVDETADDVISGRFDQVLPDEWPGEERWAQRLYSDEDLDIWLISWVPERSTELHDHAGSLGALTVISGAVTERRWTGNDLKERTLVAGDQAAFPLGWVHDVTRAPAAAPDTGPLDPTLSVHAYSPPLTAMSYYEVTGRGTLRRTHTELTTADDHEQRIATRIEEWK